MKKKATIKKSKMITKAMKKPKKNMMMELGEKSLLKKMKSKLGYK